MKTSKAIRLAAVATLAATAWSAVPVAQAHHATPAGTGSVVAGMPDGTSMSLEGRLSILDFVYPGGGGSERIYALVSQDGAATRVKFAASPIVARGASLVVSGYASHGALIVEQQQPSTRKAAAASTPASLEGTLNLLHSDNFEGGTSRFIWTLVADDGQGVELDVPIAPTDMQSGMRARVTGTRNGNVIVPDTITALSAAPIRDLPTVAASQNATVLVILLNFKATPPALPATPFTQAAVDAVVFSGAGSIAAYWNEVSFGNQTMSGVVTPWLTASFQTPATCDFYGIATEARRVAQLAGYNVASYQKVHYLFTRVPACGWAGLGEVPGTQTWSNQYNTLGVIGHELGHNFGLGHANSLPCNGATIATNCPLARPEYGDPWDIMGNVSARLGQRLAEELHGLGARCEGRQASRRHGVVHALAAQRRPAARSTPCRCPPPCIGLTGSNSGRRRASMPLCRRPPPTARSFISAASCTSRTAASTGAGTRASSTWCRRRRPWETARWPYPMPSSTRRPV